MSRRKTSDYFKKPEPEIHASPYPLCAVEGCMEEGEFKAPKSRDVLHEYQHLCEEHIREFNKQWNYFEGMNSDEIYAFQKEAVTGHRPTWKNTDNKTYTTDALDDALNRMMGEDVPLNMRAQYEPPIPRDQREALAVLDMEHPTTLKAIKKQYKMLAKKHHPDFNQGDKKSEETFKRVTQAYALLSEQYKEADKA